jgi:hypothetical protein
MSSTALIIRPKDAPEIHVLECDGPHGFVNVNRYPNEFSGKILSFEEYTALPDHSKFPRDPALWEIEHRNARRIYRLVEHAAENRAGWLSQRQLLEIRARLKLLVPFCDEDI